MDAREYYSAVSDRPSYCFERRPHVVATAGEIGEEASRAIFPSLAEPTERLRHLACERALELHLPVICHRSHPVPLAMDVAVFLAQDNGRVYASRRFQRECLGQAGHALQAIVRGRSSQQRDRSAGGTLDRLARRAFLGVN